MAPLTAEQWARLREVYDVAIGIDAAARSIYLRDACDGDAALQRELETLLRSDPRMEQFLQTPSASLLTASLADDDAADPFVGVRLGSFTVVRRIARGGMGVVYEALQENPRRRVALKVVRSVLPSAELARRFAREATVLGRLHHPGIAQIIEAGVAALPLNTADPRAQAKVPYFAMEFVEGPPITEYARHLPIAQRLRLVARVAEAVHHAHLKGVIHRDLKPANILVARDDVKTGPDAAQPKILDFGIARIVDADRESTRHTQAGELLGTLAYMSPEQLGGDPDEVDARADTYALGVILYELLTGAPAFDVGALSLPDAIQRITHHPPPPISRVDRGWRGDLETIVAVAMAPDRGRRYQSAFDLAADIERFLAKEPIAARPATALYQLRTFARRNRSLVAAAAAVVLALAGGLVAAGFGLARANEKTASAMRMNDYLRGMIAWFEPTAIGSPAPSLEQVLDEAARRIDHDLADDPEVAAALRDTIGDGFRIVGRYERAELMLQAALRDRIDLFGSADPAVAETLNHLALLYRRSGRMEKAIEAERQALDIRQAALGSDDPATIESLNNLGTIMAAAHRFSEGETLIRDAVDRHRRIGGRPIQTATGLSNLAACLLGQGRVDESLRVNEEAAALFRTHPGVDDLTLATTLSNMAEVHSVFQRDPARAEPLAREARGIRERLLTPLHPERLDVVGQHGRILGLLNRHEEALPLLKEHIAGMLDANVSPTSDQQVDAVLSLLALHAAARKLHDPSAARAALERALPLAQAVYGPTHGRTRGIQESLAELDAPVHE
jgi:eukaryotic-like serine/threonine-protein kinase